MASKVRQIETGDYVIDLTEREVAFVFKKLANGLNPLSGKKMPQNSIVQQRHIIRLLFNLSDEFKAMAPEPKEPKPAQKKTAPAPNISLDQIPPELKDLPVEFVQKHRKKLLVNVEHGKPLFSNLPWEQEDEAELRKAFFTEDSDISEIAEKFKRSDLALAAKLKSMGYLNEEDYEFFKKRSEHKAIKDREPVTFKPFRETYNIRATTQ